MENLDSETLVTVGMWGIHQLPSQFSISTVKPLLTCGAERLSDP